MSHIASSVRQPTKQYSTVSSAQEDGLGKPEQHSRLNKQDWFTFTASLACCVLGFVSVFWAPLATALGQTNQLVVVGFVLSLMAYVFQGRAQRTLAAAEIKWGQSIIQNLEGVLQLGVFGDNNSFLTRLSIIFLLGLPLGLSVAYKRLVGGITVSAGSSVLLVEFGPTPPPNTQNVGWGLSLFASTMQPWWSDPQYPGFYGYSLASMLHNKTALLDGPLSHEVSRLQSTMRSDQSQTITANVSAIEARLVASWSNWTINHGDGKTLRDLMGLSETDVCQQYARSSASCTIDDLVAAYLSNCSISYASAFLYSQAKTVGMACGTCHNGDFNNSLILIARADVPANATEQLDLFNRSAQAFQVSAKGYTGTWNITTDSAHLINALPLDGPLTNSAKITLDNIQRNAIEDTYYDFQDVYRSMVSEFDWKFPAERTAGAVNYNYALQPIANITTDATFVAAMVWSRITTKLGPTSPEYDLGSINGAEGVLKYTVPVSVTVQTQTLRRDWGMAVILSTFPVLTFLAIVLRATLLGTVPLSEGFGAMSLLAAVVPETLDLLCGAGYSGKLQTPVRALFSVQQYRGERRLRIEIMNAGLGKNEHSRWDVKGKHKIY